MDTQVVITVLILISGIAGMVYMNRRGKIKRRVDEEERLKHTEQLDSDTFYDPITEKHYTLEEALSGKWDLSEKELQTSRSDEELQRNYSGEALEIQRILNHLNKSKYPSLDTLQLPFKNFSNLHYISDYSYWSITDAYQISQNLILFLLEFEDSANPNNSIKYFPVYGGSGRTLKNTVLGLFSKSNQLSGHYFAYPSPHIPLLVRDVFSNDDELQLPDYETLTFTSSSYIENVRNIIMPYTENLKSTIEVFDNEMYVFTRRTSCIEDLEWLIDKTNS